jgi:hypothetical protein
MTAMRILIFVERITMTAKGNQKSLVPRIDMKVCVNQEIEKFCDQCPNCSNCDWSKEPIAQERCQIIKTHLGYTKAVQKGWIS